MPMTTKELASIKNSGHLGINSLFSKAHSMDWDIDRDVDWGLEIKKDDPCVDPSWSPFGGTPTFQALSLGVQRKVARHALGRTLNLLQVSESVGQDACARLALLCEEEDYRNHAVAQAMDEARHHLAFARFLEKMGDEVEEIDPYTETTYDRILASDDKTFLIGSIQFFLENMGMPLLERLAEKATHPLLKQIVSLIARDESRHVAFGVFYLTEFLRAADPEDRYAFAQYWLARIFEILEDPYGPHVLMLTRKWLRQAGVKDSDGLAERMRQEQEAIREKGRQEAVTGRNVPRLLSAARRVGLFSPDILERLHLQDHPLILGALCVPA